MRRDDFLYDLPARAIAQEAIEPRDASRLLRVGSMTDHWFGDLPGLLTPGDLLVVNRTRVRAARLRGQKATTGGDIELLLTSRIDDVRWRALVRPARRIHIGSRLQFDRIAGEVLTEPQRGVVTVRLECDEGDVDDVLPLVGELPLPPYFHGTLADPDRYQTIFAKTLGSAAAPTASLHFTPELVTTLAGADVAITEVELEVGLDTFRPLQVDDLADHVMHDERYRVPEDAAEAIAECRSRGGKVVAVGTTVVRTLETAADGWLVVPGEGVSDLFVKPGYGVKVVDALITNFHAPATTLTVMVAALIGPTWRAVYDEALQRGYRFLSFGDAMLIEDLASP